MSDSEDEQDAAQQTKADSFDWGPVTGEHLKSFHCSERPHGFHAELYEDFQNKGPYDFYKLFVNNEIINLIVSCVFLFTLNCSTFNLFGS